MRLSAIDPRVLSTVRDTLGEWSALGDGWDERSGRFAGALLETLCGSLGSLAVGTSVAAAYSAAQAEAPLQPPGYAETWAKVTLTWSVRQLLREALFAARSGSDAGGELTHLALEIAADAAALGQRPAAAPASARGYRLDRAVGLARQSLQEAKEGALVEDGAGPLLAACFDQLKHTFSLLAAQDRSPEMLLRGAVLRTDRSLRGRRVAAWMAAPLAERRALLRQGLVEAAAALALAVPGEYGPEPEQREACLWLARTAADMAACAGRVGEWLPTSASSEEFEESEFGTTSKKFESKFSAKSETKFESDSETKREGNNRSDPEGETAMKDAPAPAKQTILKTLEADATDAAWRTAGSQFVKLTRDPLVAVLSRHLAPGDDSMRAKIAAFLETEIGTALLASLLSVGLSAMPASTGAIPARLSRELRVRAMADAGDLVAEVLMGPLRQVVSLYLQDAGAVVANDREPAALNAGLKTGGNVVAMPEREAVG